jgi:hypothetical protein
MHGVYFKFAERGGRKTASITILAVCRFKPFLFLPMPFYGGFSTFVPASVGMCHLIQKWSKKSRLHKKA